MQLEIETLKAKQHWSYIVKTIPLEMQIEQWIVYHSWQIGQSDPTEGH